jgi:hypothetical protein
LHNRNVVVRFEDAVVHKPTLRVRHAILVVQHGVLTVVHAVFGVRQRIL